jgi:hypothetical protein
VVGGTVGVMLPASVGVLVGVLVAVGVAVLVGVATPVFVGVGLGPAVLVAVAVGVCVAPSEVTITNSGSFVPSRLEKLMLVLLPVLKAKL